jgi:hypothetical protein
MRREAGGIDDGVGDPRAVWRKGGPHLLEAVIGELDSLSVRQKLGVPLDVLVLELREAKVG